RKPFWEEQGFEDVGFLHAPGEVFPTWWTTIPMRTSILTAWAGGSAAERLAGLGEHELLSRALACLARAFATDRARLDSLLDAWRVADWHADPFSRGAYSYVAAGGMDAPRRLAEPVEETLYFAGEATAEHLAGTVAGALASGSRAAEEVLRAG